MAVRKNGDNFPSGKMGNINTYLLKTQIISRVIGKTNKPATVPQLVCRQKFDVLGHFLKPVKPFINVGFDLVTRGTKWSPINKATSVNYSNAIKGEFPHQEIDYSKAILTMGNMPSVENVDVQVVDGGLEFSWDPNWKIGNMLSSDRVMLLAYCPAKCTAFFILDGEKRSKGKEQLEILPSQDKVNLHTYLAFIAADRKRISTSIYTGEICY